MWIGSIQYLGNMLALSIQYIYIVQFWRHFEQIYTLLRQYLSNVCKTLFKLYFNNIWIWTPRGRLLTCFWSKSQSINKFQCQPLALCARAGMYFSQIKSIFGLKSAFVCEEFFRKCCTKGWFEKLAWGAGAWRLY